MNLKMQNAKIELIHWLTTIEDPSTLEKLLEIRDSQDQSSKTYQLNEEEAQSVNEGIKEMEKGNVVPNSEAKKVYGKWL